MASPGVAIPGSFACLSPSLAARSGMSGDQDMADFAAQPPVFTSYHYVGSTTLGYYFQMSGSDGPGCFRFHIDSAGLIDHWAYASVTCPSPLA